MTLRLKLGLIGLLLSAIHAVAEPPGKCKYCEIADVLGDASAAESAARDLPKNPGSVQIREHLIGLYSKLKDDFRLEHVLGEWEKSGAEKTPLYWFEKGELAWRRERKDEAIAAWQSGAAIRGGVDCIDRWVAQKVASGDWVGAEAILSDGIALNGEHPYPLIKRYEARMRLQKWDEAGQDIRRAGEIAADAPVVKSHYPGWERFELDLPTLAELSREIDASNEIEPVIRRAELFLKHDLLAASMADIKLARTRAPKSKILSLVEAQLASKSGKPLGEVTKIEPRIKVASGLVLYGPEEVRRFLAIENQIAATDPKNVMSGLLERAKAFRYWGQPGLAHDDAEAALALGADGALKGQALAETAHATVAMDDSHEGYRLYCEAFEGGLEDPALLAAAIEHAKARGEFDKVILFGERGIRLHPRNGFNAYVEEAKLVRDRKEWR